MLDTLLRQRIFVAAFEEGSFTLAARREHATQSGVTQHIRKLEEYLGVNLFVRSNGSGNVLPTPAGELYYNACIKVLCMHSESRRVVGAFRDDIEGMVIVGLTSLITRAVLAPTLAGFMQVHPNVCVRVLETYDEMVSQKVRAGEIDFGVVQCGHDVMGVRSEHFGRSPLFLVSSANSELGLRQGHAVRLCELGPLKLILPARHLPARAAVDAYIASSGACVERSLEIDSVVGTLDLVANSDWVSLQPAVMLVREVSDGELVVSPLLTAPYVDLFMIAVARESLEPAAAAFAHTLRKHMTTAIEAAVRLGHPMDFQGPATNEGQRGG